MKIVFQNNLGYKIVADLYIAEKDSPVIIFAHGFKSGRHSPRNVDISNALLKEGLSTFLLDFTGHGESDGALEESTMEQQSMDLKFSLDVLEKKGFQKIGVSGSSFGGRSSVLRAAEDERIRALVLRYATMEICLPIARKIQVPTLMLVGEYDHPILEENKHFLTLLQCEKDLHIIPGAHHVFEEGSQMEEALKLTVNWFKKYLK